MGKSLSTKYGPKILDSAKKFSTDAIKTGLKRAIQKTAEAAGDLIGKKIAHKITSVSKKKPRKNDEASCNFFIFKMSLMQIDFKVIKFYSTSN